MICPVGALTSSVYRFRARPWDNTPTTTTCTLCPVGCSMIIDSRDGEIVRTRSQECPSLNDIWLCDKGWFGYEFSSSDKRLTQPLIRRHGELIPVSWEEAFSFVASKMKASQKIAGCGGNHLTVEENYLFQQLLRDVLGTCHVDHRVGMPIFDAANEGLQAGMQGEIGDIKDLTHIALLGVDITEEFPIIWLRLKEAINKGAKVYFAGHFAPECSRYFDKTELHQPGKELEALQNGVHEFVNQGQKSAIFVGRQYLETKNRKAILSTLTSWKKELHVLEGRSNSVGARFAGMHPEFRPFNKKAEKVGLNITQVIETAAKTGWDVLYVAGADIASKYPTKLWQEARKNLGCLIVQDLFMTKTALEADVVLPALSFVEKGGSFINIEGRVQKLKPSKTIPKGAYCDSYIFIKIAQRLSRNLVIDEAFLNALQQERITISRPPVEPTGFQAASNDLAISFAPQLFDNGVRMKQNAHLIEMSKEACMRIHPEEAKKRGLKDGDIVELNMLQVKVCLDTAIAMQTVVLPLGFDDIPVHELSINLLNGLPVTIK